MFDSTITPTADAVPTGRVLFSVEQANRALPYVSRVVVDITEVYGQIIELRFELEHLDEGELRNLTEREYETTMDRLGYLVDELHQTGVELRDFELGRVDFPAVLEGEEVMLTWQTGQTAVTQWHALDADDEVLHTITTAGSEAA